jgi:hypothetical protein
VRLIDTSVLVFSYFWLVCGGAVVLIVVVVLLVLYARSRRHT